MFGIDDILRRRLERLEEASRDQLRVARIRFNQVIVEAGDIPEA